ncbi:hypothetical protein EN858_05160 [Mesorhizobium sp. M4B.F.Ca.ET.215.01.1.1]|uniref:Uncharacterized protein n=1 Tax=Mesorhizobium abyssinicae TaxID=1209958 RepID=A0ABU5AHW2_9HYPH|nr:MULTISPECIES: hypothetical protein [Mesorhizobium]MDX8536864.1 hypothetical protein [Mesorhizobium abyssinicae]RUW24103.1 hypothetical protein EOA34_16170 [Mesorhizobium sp. M4B.F.Ca.ET.013.02.1.1]RVD43573.1 hypothetical protein EN741_09585 [Mesorhizobium sp. M4B.F.Ca.ET.019.03.1.1]RWX65490.1 hypothetical protein EN780_17910 [Mesorhizobium sp. M4B.F.Ca.ET.089.01.1.1]TGQ15236.1 hypothetical protein EN858_05160 [Mesorhizobium sp. M4B.F.Ca.ET.215.01.1.1]
MAKGEFLAGVGAAPHLPAGILSPYGNGEREAFTNGFANRKRRSESAEIGASPFLPVSIRGEMSGRTMRGGAGVDNWSEATALATLSGTAGLLKKDDA